MWLRLPQFWKKSYGSLEEALKGIDVGEKSCHNRKQGLTAQGLALRMTSYEITCPFRKGHIEVVVEVGVDALFGLNITDAYQEIRTASEGTSLSISAKFKI